MSRPTESRRTAAMRTVSGKTPPISTVAGSTAMQARMNWHTRIVSTPKLADSSSQVKTYGSLSVMR